jgi:hypothetical protein
MKSKATGAINAPEILEAIHLESSEAQAPEVEEEEELLEEAPGNNIDPLQRENKIYRGQILGFIASIKYNNRN